MRLRAIAVSILAVEVCKNRWFPAALFCAHLKRAILTGRGQSCSSLALHKNRLPLLLITLLGRAIGLPHFCKTYGVVLRTCTPKKSTARQWTPYSTAVT